MVCAFSWGDIILPILSTYRSSKLWKTILNRRMELKKSLIAEVLKKESKMFIRYKQDDDLEFLQFCTNDDLGILVDILIKDKDGVKRRTEGLTTEERYKNCNGDYVKIWDLIAGELQLFGGDSIMNLLRGGRGNKYRNILSKVCKRNKVDFDSESTTEDIEVALLLKILGDSLEDISEEELREFGDQVGVDLKKGIPGGIAAALRLAINMGGFKSYQLAVIVANAAARKLAGRGLAVAANAALARWLGVFAGPAGLIVSGLLAIPMITSPANRLIGQACVLVAYMRQKNKYRDHIGEM